MKLLLLRVSFPLLLFAFLLGKDAGSWAQLSPSLVLAKDEDRVNASLGESQQLKLQLDPPGTHMYAPVRSCHRELREKYGEFSPPDYSNRFEGNIWCNWTVWAGSRKHIVIYIKGFKSDEGCDKNEDKIFFNGVSSLAENMVIYACWKKEVHVFATYARGVHVVYLMRWSTNPKKKRLVGRYYIFKHRESKPPDEDILDSKIRTPDPSLPTINIILPSQKRPFIFVSENDNSSSSPSHRIDKTTDLPKSLQAKEGNVGVEVLTSKFIWQVTSTLPLTSESLPLLHVLNSEENSCKQMSPVQLIEVQNSTVWAMGIEELSVGLGEPTILSEDPYLDVSTTELMGPVGGTEIPSTPLSINLVSFLKSDLQMGSRATQPDYHVLNTNFWTVSHDAGASTEASTLGFKEVISMSCQTSSLAHKAGTDAIDLEAISLFTLEQNLIDTKIHTDYVLLPSETSERGGPQGHPESSVLLLGDVILATGWETETVPITEHITKVLDVYPILESSEEIASELKVALAATVESTLESDLLLRPRNEQSSAEMFLDLLAEMPDASSIADLKSSHLLDAEHETPLFPSKTPLAPLRTAVLELFPSLLLGIVEMLPLPTMELEPLFSNSTTGPFLLSVPDLQPTTLGQEHALSSLMMLTYPFISIGLDTIFSTPAMPLEPTLSEEEPIDFSIAETLSLEAEELEAIISTMESAWSPTIISVDLELGTSATVLESVLAPTTTIKSLGVSETISAFSQEIVPSFDLRIVGVDSTLPSWRSSCCQPAMDASEQDDAFLATVWSSSLSGPVMGTPYSNHHTAFFSSVLEDLFPSTEVTTIIEQPLLERRDDDSAVRLGDREAHFVHLNLAFKSELFPSLNRFTVSARSLLNGHITEIPFTFVPIVSEKKKPRSLTECGFVSNTVSTPSLPHTEMQSQMMQPMTLKVTKKKLQPITSWGRPHNAEWDLAGKSLEFTVANLNVAGTLDKAQTQNDPLDLHTRQTSSDFENNVTSKVGHLGSHLELELPWLLAYLPAKSCHVVLKDEFGTFSPPVLGSMQSNMWCNWTIWAGPQKHILIYIEGFEGNSVCEENQDKIIFQGVLSSVESKIAYACRNHGTLIFATQAVAVHVVFLSKVSSQNPGHKHFKGRYYTFDDYEVSNLTGDGDDTEEPVVKSNSDAIFFPKSYAVHPRHVGDFVKLSRKLSDEDATQVSPSKSTENVTLNILDVMMQVAKPSFDDRTEINTSPNNLKKILELGSESLENKGKVMLYKPTVASASPLLSQKFKTVTKLVLVKNAGVTEATKFVGPITAHERPKSMKDIGGAVFGRYILQSGITFPDTFLEEQRSLIPPPKSIPVKEQDQGLHALTPKDGISRKTTKVMNFRHLEPKEALEGEKMKMDNEENGNNDQYVAVAAAKGRNKSHKSEILTTEMPKNLTVKKKSHLGSPQVLSTPPPRIFNSDLTVTASLNSSGFLREPQNTQVEASIPADSGNTDHSLQKGTTLNHLYSVPDWGSSNEASLGEEHKNNFSDNILVFRSHENYTILKFQHDPGDVLFEITFGIDHKGQIPHNGSEQEKALVESIKLQVQEKVKHFSNKVKEIGLKEIIRKDENELRRRNAPNLIFTFWLHLKPEEKNISHFIHSRLKDLSGESMGAGEIQLVSVGDVNECSSGIELCGDEAVCLNGYGTYVCQCKEEYEDRSLKKMGTLCVHSPRSGIDSLFSYAEILVGTTVFFIFVLVVVVSVLCSIVKRCPKENEDSGLEQAILPGTRTHSQPTDFQQDNILNLLALDPEKLKLRAKSPEWHLQPKTSPGETYRVSIEQSECL